MFVIKGILKCVFTVDVYDGQGSKSDPRPALQLASDQTHDLVNLFVTLLQVIL